MIWSGFIIGLLGSLHCVGMCGPLALAIPSGYQNRLVSALVYNGGRTLTYGMLGVLVGFLGLGIQLAGYQSFLSIFTGLFIILLVIFPVLEQSLFRLTKIDFGGWVRHHMSDRLKKSGLGSSFLLGVLNGLLPCGLIYAGLAGAIETGYIESAALYMILFGMGTSILMIGTMLTKGLVLSWSWFKPRKLVPYLTFFLGVLFITRGLLYMRPIDAPQTATIEFLQTITMCHAAR